VVRASRAGRSVITARELVDDDIALREVGHNAQFSTHRFNEAPQGAHIPIRLAFHLRDGSLVEIERDSYLLLGKLKGLPEFLK